VTTDQPAALDIVAHLPGVGLEGVDEVRFGGGRLVHLPFDEWVALDDAFPQADSHYERSRPLFYRVAVDGAPAAPSLVAAAQAALEGPVTSAYHALRFAGQDLIHPRMAVVYATAPGGGARVTLVGPINRELVIYGRGSVALAAGPVAAARALLPLAEHAIAVPPVRAALDVLELTSRPEIGAGETAFVLSVAALEALLIPDERRRPQERFARMLGALYAASWGGDPLSLAPVAAHAAALYRIRNRVVHGQDPSGPIAQASATGGGAFGWGIGPALLAHIAQLVTTVMRERDDGIEAVRALIARSWDDPGALKLLTAIVGREPA
jgi:hypothetical protein